MDRHLTTRTSPSGTLRACDDCFNRIQSAPPLEHPDPPPAPRPPHLDILGDFEGTWESQSIFDWIGGEFQGERLEYYALYTFFGGTVKTEYFIGDKMEYSSTEKYFFSFFGNVLQIKIGGTSFDDVEGYPPTSIQRDGDSLVIGGNEFTRVR